MCDFSVDDSASCSSVSSTEDAPLTSHQRSSADSDSRTSSTTKNVQASGKRRPVQESLFVPAVTSQQRRVHPSANRAGSPSPRAAKHRRTRCLSPSSSSDSDSREKTTRRRRQKEKLSPEEEEKRRLRRERNKIAAAKCRNRRRELTERLQNETEDLEDEKAGLQAEIEALLREKEQLEAVLSAHQPTCKMTTEEDDVDVEDMQTQSPQSAVQHSPSSSTSSSALEPSSISTQALGLQLPSPLQDLELHPGSISISSTCSSTTDSSTTAILGDSDILLCSSALGSSSSTTASAAAASVSELDTYLGVVKGVESQRDLGVRESDGGSRQDTAPAVPDIDLSGSLGISDWETLYRSMSMDNLGLLNSPGLISSPTCGGSLHAFEFNYPDFESLAMDDCDCSGQVKGRSEMVKDLLNSPTLLAL